MAHNGSVKPVCPYRYASAWTICRRIFNNRCNSDVSKSTISHGTTMISFLGKRKCALNRPHSGPLTSTWSGINAFGEKNRPYSINWDELMEIYVFKLSSVNLATIYSAHV